MIVLTLFFIIFVSSAYNQGYNQGITDYNNNVNDTSHNFICPLAPTHPHSEYCSGYDSALRFEFSDQ